MAELTVHGENYLVNRAKKGLIYALIVIGAILMVIPLAWMISTSLKEPSQVMVYPPKWIPHPVAWENYKTVWNILPFGHFYLNSIKIAIFVVIGQLFSCSLAAFAFARLKFPGRDKLFLVLLGTLMIPFQVTLIPVFIIMKWLGWVDTHLALIVPAFFGSVFGTFLLRQFFITIPQDLFDAAKVDGCGFFRMYWHIALPLARPALAALGIFVFMNTWNDFLSPLIYLNSPEKMTIPLGLATLSEWAAVKTNILMAGSVISILPVLLIYFFAQRYFINGITLTGLKE